MRGDGGEGEGQGCWEEGGKKVERAVSGPIGRLNFRPGQPVTVSHSVPPAPAPPPPSLTASLPL